MNAGFATMWNALPIVPFDNLGQAIYKGYCQSDILYSVVNKKAKTGSRSLCGVYRIKSISAKQKYDEYRQRKDIRLDKLLELKEAAIEPKKHYLNDVFANPNDEQSGAEYEESLLTFLNVTGNCFEYAVMNGKEVLRLHSLPAHLVDIIPDKEWPIGASAYKMKGVSLKEFKLEEIIHAKYNNPRWTIDGKHLYGMSPLEVLWNLLQGDDEGFSAIAEQMKSRGPRKLVGIDNDKITDQEKGIKMMAALREEFKDRSKDFRDKVMPLWGKISVEDIGISAKDMDVTGRSQLTFERVCNALSVPVEWFSTNVQSKYDNMEIFTKQALINGVFPDKNKIIGSRNRWARKYEIITPAEVIDFDETVYSELEVDRAKMMQWLKDSPYSLDEQRQFLGDQPTNAPGMTEVLAPRNKVPISKLGDLKTVNNGQQDQQNDTSAS